MRTYAKGCLDCRNCQTRLSGCRLISEARKDRSTSLKHRRQLATEMWTTALAIQAKTWTVKAKVNVSTLSAAARSLVQSSQMRHNLTLTLFVMAQSEPSSSDTKSQSSSVAASGTGPWQAIYSPQHNNYYFYNAETQETTWENPLVTESAQEENKTEQTAATNTDQQSATAAAYTALQQAAVAQGIDPSLAYLDPSLAASPSASSLYSSYAVTAKFNARTGQFTGPNARDPSHMSEYERARRMSEFYFDVAAWERQRAQEHEVDPDGLKKRKRPTKKDLVSFLADCISSASIHRS